MKLHSANSPTRKHFWYVHPVRQCRILPSVGRLRRRLWMFGASRFRHWRNVESCRLWDLSYTIREYSRWCSLTMAFGLLHVFWRKFFGPLCLACSTNTLSCLRLLRTELTASQETRTKQVAELHCGLRALPTVGATRKHSRKGVRCWSWNQRWQISVPKSSTLHSPHSSRCCHLEKVHKVHLRNTEQNQSTWAASPPVGCHYLHRSPSSVITITLPKSLTLILLFHS